jgi:AbrB family looped-hinge helix DNA binding protein
MVNIVEVDKAGRIVLPKKLRDELGIKEKTQLILTKRSDGTLIVMKLDVDEIARRLEEELKGVDVDGIAESIRKEINAKIIAEHPELSPG